MNIVLFVAEGSGVLFGPRFLLCMSREQASRGTEVYVASPLEQEILNALERRAAEHEIDIVDVEVSGSQKAPVVRVRIDHADEEAPAITLNEITAQNEWIGELIDEIDPFPGSYNLEVSSPGLARPLRRERDFERFAGEDVTINLNASEGRRKYTGELLGMVDGKVAIATDEGEFSFDLAQIKTAKIKPNYDELARASKSGKEGK